MLRRFSHSSALDGLRGLAVLLVFLSHANIYPFKEGGGVGVSMFFALSGFLITILLLQEKILRKSINLTAFYQRRFLRLMPALLVIAMILYVLNGVTAFQLFSVLLYFGNFQRVNGDDLGRLHHTWSLAIEEQFYIVWPFLLLFWVPYRTRLYLTSIGILFVLLSSWRGCLWYSTYSITRVHFGTDTNFPCILAGCFCALYFAASKRTVIPPWVAYLSFAGLFALSGVLRIMGSGISYLYTDEFTFTFSWPLVGVLTSVVIFYLLTHEVGFIHRMLEVRALCFLGKVSYGFYLWHLPVIYVITNYFPNLKNSLIVFIFSLWFSWVSYIFVEKPFLRLKHKLGGECL